jgi:5-(aminomethyl)-3-furanmethanol phosphate kinase
LNNSGLLIKFGGSLCEPQVLPPLAKVIRRLAATVPVTILPGGGPFANAVRDWDRRQHLGDTTSHWMAIAAMDQFGRFLESGGFGVAVYDPAMLGANGTPRIFLPYRFLHETDPLPHSWSVTSDSIAAYLASVFRINRLVLLKATDGPTSPCSVSTAVEASLIDSSFNQYLNENTECWIVNGNSPEGLTDLENAGVRLLRNPAI